MPRHDTIYHELIVADSRTMHNGDQRHGCFPIQEMQDRSNREKTERQAGNVLMWRSVTSEYCNSRANTCSKVLAALQDCNEGLVVLRLCLL